MIVEVNVTQKCIDTGAHRKPWGCMVNLAMTGLVDKWVSISVAQTHVVLYGPYSGGLKSRLLTFPPEVSERIRRWDSNEFVSAFTFSLDIPDEFLRPIAAPSWPVRVESEVAHER